MSKEYPAAIRNGMWALLGDAKLTDSVEVARAFTRELLRVDVAALGPYMVRVFRVWKSFDAARRQEISKLFIAEYAARDDAGRKHGCCIALNYVMKTRSKTKVAKK